MAGGDRQVGLRPEPLKRAHHNKINPAVGEKVTKKLWQGGEWHRDFPEPDVNWLTGCYLCYPLIRSRS